MTTSAPLPADAGPARRPGTATALFAGRTLRRLSRQPEVLVQSLFFSAALLLLLLAVFGGVVNDAIGGGYVNRLLPLIVLEGAAFGAIAAGIGLRSDLDSGMVRRVRSLPVRPGALVTGRVVADAARILVSTLVLLVIGTAVGFRFTNGVGPAVAFVAVAVILGQSFTWLASYVGMVARSPEAVTAGLTPLFLLALFLSSAFVPVEAFPTWIQPIVRVKPLSCGSSLMQALATGGDLNPALAQTAAWAVTLSAVFGAASFRRWKRLGLT